VYLRDLKGSLVLGICPVEYGRCHFVSIVLRLGVSCLIYQDCDACTPVIQHGYGIADSVLHQTIVMGFVLRFWSESKQSYIAMAASCSDFPDENLKDRLSFHLPSERAQIYVVEYQYIPS